MSVVMRDHTHEIVLTVFEYVTDRFVKKGYRKKKNLGWQGLSINVLKSY